MSKSVIMFSETMDGDIMFNGLITRETMINAKPSEVKVLTDEKSPLHEKMFIIATIFEGRILGEAY